MGVTGKKLLWRALATEKLPQLNSYNFEQLQRRAEQQVERIEAERISAVRQAFAELIARNDCFLNARAWDKHSERESNRTRRRG